MKAYTNKVQNSYTSFVTQSTLSYISVICMLKNQNSLISDTEVQTSLKSPAYNANKLNLIVLLKSGYKTGGDICYI